MDFSTVSFLLLGILATVLSGFLVTRRWPVSAAMLLIATFAVLAAMYGLLDAHFSAVAQIIVYAGAIMVVFVFVIMLLNLPPEELRYGTVTPGEALLSVLGVGAAFALGTKLGRGSLEPLVSSWASTGGRPAAARPPFLPEDENIRNVAALMFTDYLWAFELISFLILAAIIGSVVIAKKRSHDAKSA